MLSSIIISENISGTLTSTSTLGQSESGYNGKKGVLYTHLI